LKTFIEIGACDFDTCLPLAENGWAGILVEPVREISDNLVKQTIKYGFVKVLNMVVSDYDGEIDFHVSNGDGWAKGISSVASSNHKGAKMFEIENGLNKKFLKETRRLQCITLDTLIEDAKFTEIDLLKIDAEGHETNIIEAYSWKVKPTMIKLEHAHIDDINMKRILEEQGYIVWTEQNDMYAIC